MWWVTYGESAPELQRIAIKVLSQTTSSSNCERNWSMWSLVHTKTRNRLKYKRLHMIVYVRYNMKLKMRHLRRRGNDEINCSFDPINLDYIFDEDDPLNEWVEETEQPVFDGDDLGWLEDDYDDNGVGGNDDTQDDGSRGLGTTPPFQYNTTQSSVQSRQSALTPPSSDNGSDNDGDGDGGGYARDQYSTGPFDNVPQWTPYVEEHNTPYTRGPQTYERRQRGRQFPNEAVDADSSWHGFSTNVFHPESSGSNYYGGMPYSFNNFEAPTQPDSSSTFGENYGSAFDSQHDNVQIYNHGTINNYGDVHYHQPIYFGGNSSQNSHQNEPSLVDAAGSYLFGDTSRRFHNDREAEQEGPRRSFWF